MKRSTSNVRSWRALWFWFILRLRRCFRLRYLLTLFILSIVLTYAGHINDTLSNQLIFSGSESIIEEEEEELMIVNYTLFNQNNLNQTEFLLHSYNNNNNNNDSRPQPTIQRLQKLFQILLSYENKYDKIFDYLGIFRFNNFPNTLYLFANNTEYLKNIYCLFQKYINISDNGYIININDDLISYLKLISNYLSDGFKNKHLNWNNISKTKIQKPVIILAANSHFFDTLQASMRTINEHLNDYKIAIYDLQFSSIQLKMIKENCERCTIIPFPFTRIESVAPHIRNLGTFAWKPIVIQDAIRRFGSIIYGDTSIRYKTSKFDHLLIDNLIRGFSCRELPEHYLSCFTLEKTFLWFNETSSSFDNIYIAEAGFLAVTDNFLSRLILKTWVTCALD
ncbi:unnamed protein product, partial [Rotaria sp. Silwood1]